MIGSKLMSSNNSLRRHISLKRILGPSISDGFKIVSIQQSSPACQIQYIVGVYWKTLTQTEYKNTLMDGPKILFQEICCQRELFKDTGLISIMQESVQQSCFFGHPENLLLAMLDDEQRWSREHKTQGQGQGHKKNARPGPRTSLPRTDSRGQEQECSRPRRKCSWKKNFFQVISKKVFKKIFDSATVT